jgi:hypothetical protein
LKEDEVGRFSAPQSTASLQQHCWWRTKEQVSWAMEGEVEPDLPKSQYLSPLDVLLWGYVKNENLFGISAVS